MVSGDDCIKINKNTEHYVDIAVTQLLSKYSDCFTDSLNSIFM